MEFLGEKIYFSYKISAQRTAGKIYRNSLGENITLFPFTINSSYIDIFHPKLIFYLQFFCGHKKFLVDVAKNKRQFILIFGQN